MGIFLLKCSTNQNNTGIIINGILFLDGNHLQTYYAVILQNKTIQLPNQFKGGLVR